MKHRNFISSLLLLSLCTAVGFAGVIAVGAGGAGSITVASGGAGTLSRDNVAPAVCLGTFATDTFAETGSGTVNLNTHVSEDGVAWLGTDASDGSIVLDRSAGEIRSTNSGGVTKTSTLDFTATCADYSVTATAKTGSTGTSHRVGVRGRIQPVGDNCYRFRIEGDGTARLEKVVSGTASDLATGTVASFSASTYYPIELRMSGTTIQGYVDNVLKCSATDSTYTTPGSIGILLRNANVRMTALVAAYL